MKKTIFVFSALIISLLVLFKISTYSYTSGNSRIEYVISGIAIVFFGIGLYINRRSPSKKNLEPKAINLGKLDDLGISKREYEVLVQIAKGLSNKEIGDTLHLSESTVKTHVSNLLVKLDAKRRTQALQRAKELNIIAI
ncbi:MAG: response regulator transcription factor [Bacteroidota bacterium]